MLGWTGHGHTTVGVSTVTGHHTLFIVSGDWTGGGYFLSCSFSVRVFNRDG